MRNDGLKVGLLKIRVYRPFPADDIKKALSGMKKVAVVEKNLSSGSRMLGIVGLEVKDAINDSSISVLSYVAGLGGRDIRKSDIRKIVNACNEGKGNMFSGLREEIL